MSDQRDATTRPAPIERPRPSTGQGSLTASAASRTITLRRGDGLVITLEIPSHGTSRGV